MSNARLVTPSENYMKNYKEACLEMKEYDGSGSGFFRNPDAFVDGGKALLKEFEDYRLGINLPNGYVPASTFWLVDGSEFIGEGSVRHRLTPFLERLGGHIGYAVRPSKRNMGYATLMLSLLLGEAYKLGICPALITCGESNMASSRVILKNGGVYQDTIPVMLGAEARNTKRFWVDTSLS